MGTKRSAVLRAVFSRADGLCTAGTVLRTVRYIATVLRMDFNSQRLVHVRMVGSGGRMARMLRGKRPGRNRAMQWKAGGRQIGTLVQSSLLHDGSWKSRECTDTVTSSTRVAARRGVSSPGWVYCGTVCVRTQLPNNDPDPDPAPIHVQDGLWSVPARNALIPLYDRCRGARVSGAEDASG